VEIVAGIPCYYCRRIQLLMASSWPESFLLFCVVALGIQTPSNAVVCLGRHFGIDTGTTECELTFCFCHLVYNGPRCCWRSGRLTSCTHYLWNDKNCALVSPILDGTAPFPVSTPTTGPAMVGQSKLLPGHTSIDTGT
jgi:hypothetical protein